MQQRKRLEESLAQDRGVAGAAEELDTLFELAREGEPVLAEIDRQIPGFAAMLGKLETAMLLDGEHSGKNAIVTVHPGAGGTESQDWAEMLLRMYLRWAERNGFTATVTDRLEGDGAGIKSATFEVAGENAYGQLQAEIGVHRLVRISPFDANARRHTSFASVFVLPEIDDDIQIEIKPEDLKVDVFRASGAGGQHVNRTESAVRMTHLPTGIVVQCQNERSQHKNRASALKQMRAKLFEAEMDKRRAEERKLEASKADINFGSQIRSYVLAPYRLIKDHRTKASIGDVDRVLDGDLEDLIHAFLVWKKTGKTAAADGGKEDLDE
jgi:peptide chain release factor 2